MEKVNIGYVNVILFYTYVDSSTCFVLFYTYGADTERSRHYADCRHDKNVMKRCKQQSYLIPAI